MVASFIAIAVACAQSHAPPQELTDEVNRLRSIMASDPAQRPLTEVEHAVDTRRPVLGGELLESGGLPAARRQVEAIQQAHFTNESVRHVQGHAVRAYRDRVAALVQYQRVLVRGGTEDAELAEALHAQSAAERELLDVHRELDLLAPIPEH